MNYFESTYTEFEMTRLSWAKPLKLTFKFPPQNVDQLLIYFLNLPLSAQTTSTEVHAI